MMVLIVLITLACLLILVIKLFVVNTTTTGASGTNTVQMIGSTTSALLQGVATTSLGPNNGSFFGDGSDGTTTYTDRPELALNKDAFYNNLTLNHSTLNTNGFRLFVAGTLTLVNNSVVQNCGKDGGTNNAFGNGPVPGGLGALAGTLGGGGNGGNGYLKDGTMATINGVSVSNVLWGNDTTAFVGADGSGSAAVAAYGIGSAGRVDTNSVRSAFDAVQALNASFTPTLPLLSGGSGGGGGQGSAAYPGSGGGGGGGVIVMSVRNLVVAPNGGTINASGGNAGLLAAGGPFNATSGGGGGGGLILLATLSPPASYSGLTFNVAGGMGVDSVGSAVQANSGRIVNWFNTTETDTNPNQFLTATKTVKQIISGNDKAIVYDNIEQNAGIVPDSDSAVYTVQQPGLYLVISDINADWSDPGTASIYVVKNGDPSAAIFGKRTTNFLGAPQTMSINTTIPLNTRDTFEIRVAKDDDDSSSITILPDASLSTVLLVPGATP
jgi:hypothetical protein